MNFEHRHELRTEARLTPQLVLNLKLLVLPGLDLQQLIENELEQNPALEMADDGDENAGFDSAETEAPGISGEPDVPTGILGGDPAEEFDIADLLPQDSWEVAGYGAEENGKESAIAEIIPDARITYHDILLPKLLTEIEPQDTHIAEEIVEWLDEDGFLSVPPERISELTGISLEKLNRVLDVLQRIPPGGIGCPDMRSALLKQLNLRGYDEASLEYRLLSEHWELVMQQNYRKLAGILQIDISDVEQAVKNISSLEPRPGRQFTSVSPEYVMPDFSIEWQDGKFVAIEQDSYIPRIRVARRFVEIVQHPQGYPAETVAFARKKVSDALMFIRALEYRRRLLRRLMDWIIRRQGAFLQHGTQFLRPAKLKEVATDLGVHPATVSRAISGKYVETQFGIFKLRDFFETGTGGVARTGIKEKIQALIAAEDKSRPLSDEEICERLQVEGIKISRRTVAKYRAELGIPGSDERRRS
ncbi:MAG: RNA polymerase factor sigma-54 [candidate division WOR-3 bacterium]